MKFSITKHEKFEMGCMLLANVLCLFLYGNSTNGPVTLTLEILVAFIALLWVFIFTSESINVLTFVARMRAEEESSRDRLDWEKGLKVRRSKGWSEATAAYHQPQIANNLLLVASPLAPLFASLIAGLGNPSPQAAKTNIILWLVEGAYERGQVPG